MTNAGRDIYTSSNGDRWTLVIDSKGDPAVQHKPNVSSGGTSTHIEVGNFLMRDRGSPQQQELLRLIGTLAADQVPPVLQRQHEETLLDANESSGIGHDRMFRNDAETDAG